MESDCYTDCCSYFMLYIFTSFLSDKKRVSLYISGTQIQVNTLSHDKQAFYFQSNCFIYLPFVCSSIMDGIHRQVSNELLPEVLIGHQII